MSNSTAQGVALPNPNTPLAFLDPEVAYQTSVSVYVLAGALGVLCWDILEYTTSDFKLLFRNRISFTTVVYFLSRIGSLGYVIASNIFETAPTGNCGAFDHIADAWYPMSLGFSALLFFFRIRAIYNRNRILVCFFFLLWLALVGCTMLIPIGILGDSIGPTNYCEDAIVPSYSYAAIIAPLVHDTLVFVAISWRLAGNAHVDSGFKEGIKIAVFGKYLPTFTKSLLKDGQKYYLLTLISNLVTVIMVFNTHIPVPMRSMFATPNLVLTNIMACRVYRNTKFGLVRESEISTSNMKENNTGLVLGPLFAHSTRATTEVSYRIETTNLNNMPFKEDAKVATASDSTVSKGKNMVRLMKAQTLPVNDIESQTQSNNI